MNEFVEGEITPEHKKVLDWASEPSDDLFADGSLVPKSSYTPAADNPLVAIKGVVPGSAARATWLFDRRTDPACMAELRAILQPWIEMRAQEIYGRMLSDNGRGMGMDSWELISTFQMVLLECTGLKQPGQAVNPPKHGEAFLHYVLNRCELQYLTIMSKHRSYSIKYQQKTDGQWKNLTKLKDPPQKKFTSEPVEETLADTIDKILLKAPSKITGVKINPVAIIDKLEAGYTRTEVARELGVTPASLTRELQDWARRVGVVPRKNKKIRGFPVRLETAHSSLSIGREKFVPDRLRWLLEDAAYTMPGKRTKLIEVQDRLRRNLPRNERQWTRAEVVWELRRLGLTVEKSKSKTIYVSSLTLKPIWGSKRLTTRELTADERWTLLGLSQMKTWTEIRRLWRGGRLATDPSVTLAE